MTLLALFLGLAIERAATHLLRLREPRWFDGYLQWTLGRSRDQRGARLVLLTIMLVLLPVLPVALVAALFHDVLLGVLYVAFATVVLIFSLGPRDLHDEVDDYLTGLETGDQARAARVAQEIMESDAAQRTRASPDALEDAIFVQTNNRTFGVAFWFMLAGPAGAWAFRVSDLMRRRAVFEYRGRAATPGDVPEFVHTLQVIHGVLAWAPARLLALGYALGGHFDRAMAEWKRYAGRAGAHFFDVNDQMLANVGRGALEAPVAATGVMQLPDIDRVRACMAVVNRALLVWLVFVSALVLAGWIR